MVVFNLYAIPVAIVVALIGWGASALFGLEGNAENLIYALAAIVVGGLGEVVGLKARLFWLPVWLLGIVSGTYSSWAMWGYGGLAAGGVLFVVGVALLFVLGKASTIKAVAAAPAHYEPARAALMAGDQEAFWTEMSEAYVAPPSGPVAAEYVAHCIATLDLLDAAGASLAFSQPTLALIASARSVYCEMQSSLTGPSVFAVRGSIVGEVGTLIVKRGDYTPSAGVMRDVEEIRGAVGAS